MIISNDRDWRRRPINGLLRLVVWALLASPIAVQGVPHVWQGLGPDPALAVLKITGLWAMLALGVVLLLTPIQRFAAWPGLASVRRLVGLWAFFYTALHAFGYVSFDQGFDAALIISDAMERPMIAVGWGATGVMLWMAATSNGYAIKRLGYPLWKSLHRWIYVAAVLAWLHLYWVHSGKHIWTDVLAFGVWFGVALSLRLIGIKRSPSSQHREPDA